MAIEYRNKNHINIMNLLSKCEYRFQQHFNDKNDWRLEQVISFVGKFHFFKYSILPFNFSVYKIFISNA